MSPSPALARRILAVGLLAGLLALLLVNDRGVPQSATTTVNFDTPAPPGGPGPLGGVFQGIDFGTGQWAWTDPYDVDSRRVPRPPLGHDSQLQSQPEVPGPELHAGRDEVDRPSSSQREPRASGLLHALHRERQWGSVGRPVRPLPGALRRHDRRHSSRGG